MSADAESSEKLSGLETDLKDVRADLRELVRRSKELVKAGKARRDEGLIAKLRRQIGLG